MEINYLNYRNFDMRYQLANLAGNVKNTLFILIMLLGDLICLLLIVYQYAIFVYKTRD